MSDRVLKVLLEGGSFFEGPRWHEGRWFVSDFFEHHVLAIDPDGTVEEVMVVPTQPSGLGWMPDGSMLVVSMLDKRILRRYADGTVELHADMSEIFPGAANDMVVDRFGRAYVGNFGGEVDPADPHLRRTCIGFVDADGRVSVAADEIFFPNGSVITPDGSTLIVGESIGKQYTAFSIRPDGSLVDRRVWGAFAPDMQIGPDGCTLNADGNIWMADPYGGPCRLLAPGAVTVDEIAPPPGLTIFACMLGGNDGRTLLVCAAGPRSSYDGTRGSAVLLTTTVDVPHAGLP